MKDGGSAGRDAEARRRAAGWAGAGLASLALAQPLFQQVASHPAFLTEHSAGPAQVLVLALALGVVPPLLAAWAASRRGTVGRVLRTLCLLLAVAALARQAAAAIELPGLVQVAAALAVGAGAVLLFERKTAARTFFAALGLAAVAVPMLFLGAAAVRPFWWPTADDVEISDLGAATLPVPDLQVVVVVFDELPASILYATADGSLDADRYPAFAELARSSHEFRRAYSVAGSTDRAMPSLLTGLYPRRQARGLILAEYPDNLFSLAGQALQLDVYNDVGLLPGARRAAEDARPGLFAGVAAMLGDLSLVYLHWLLPPELRRDLPDLHGGWTGLWSRTDRRPERSDGSDADGVEPGLLESAEHGQFRIFSDWVGDLEPAARPTLHYIHPMLPHQPWALLPTLQVYNDPWTVPSYVGADGNGHVWGDHAWSVLQTYQRVMLQTAAVDRQLGRLLRRLDEPGFAGRTLLAVIADHGIGFRPGACKRDGDFDLVASEILWVPLFVRLPGQSSGTQHDEYVESVDLVPTLLAATGFDPQRIRALGLDGRDALGETARAPEDSVLVRLHGASPADLQRLDELAAAARGRRAQLFGEAAAASASDLWWRVGPDEELRRLVGRSVAELVVRDEPAGVALFERPRVYDLVDPDGPRVPSWLNVMLRADAASGAALDAEPRPRERVAVAVEGVVAAVTEARFERGEIRVSALLPPASFRDGANDLRLYAVRPDGLRPLPRLDVDERLQRQVAEARAVASASGPSMLEELAMQPMGSVHLIEVADGVAVDSAAIRPKVQLRLRDSYRLRHMILQLDVTSDVTTALAARWQDPGDPGFRRTRHAAADLLPGRQTVRIEVVRDQAPEPAGDLPPELAEPKMTVDRRADVWQLEVGQLPGRYVLHSVEIFDAEAP